MNRNYTKIILLSTAILFFACKKEENIKPTLDTPPLAELDVRDNLSGTNFDNFVRSNKTFELKINDTLKILFEDIVYPNILDPKADVVYTTKDNKGSIACVDGLMSFVYQEGKNSFKGSLYNNLSEKLEYQKILSERKKEQSKNKDEDDGFRLIEDNKISGESQSYSLIEYKTLSESDKPNYVPMDSSKKRNSYCSVVDGNSNSVLQKRGYYPKSQIIRLYVYTMTTSSVSNTDINYAKIHTRNSLRDAYGNNYVFERKVLTYFNASMSGLMVTGFANWLGNKGYSGIPYTGILRNVNSSKFLSLWKEFGLATWGENTSGSSISKYYNKRLLLTRYGFGLNKGVAYLDGDYAFAKASAVSHSTPGHEVGHMFGAIHSSVYSSGWWFSADIMCSNRSLFYIKSVFFHTNSSNISSIRNHINRIIK